MFFKKASHGQLAITVMPSHITLTTPKKSRIIAASDILAPNLHILNLSKLKTILESFKKANDLNNPQTIIALEGKDVHELVADNQFNPTRPLQHLVWHGKPLSSIKNTPYYFCGMSRELIFHYQLLAHLCKLSLIGITSCTYARLTLADSAYHTATLNELKANLKHHDQDLAVLKLIDQEKFLPFL